MVVAQLQQHVVAKNSKTSLETSSADGKTLVPVSEMGRITCDMEFRFMLHRHWSLYEVSVLALWRVLPICFQRELAWNTGNRPESCVAKVWFHKYPSPPCRRFAVGHPRDLNGGS